MTDQHIQELIRKYAHGKASTEEIQTLMDWYRLRGVDGVEWPGPDPAEKEHVYRRMLDRLQHEISANPEKVSTFSWSRVAAFLALLAGVSAISIYFLKPFSRSYITVANPSGKIHLVHLPDSSLVWLNASSTLRYGEEFSDNRDLELQGEAFFKVTPDAKHPFTVQTGGVLTRVVGTAFNIKAYRPDNSIRISVISGKVKISDNSKDLAVLTPSTQLQLDRQHHTASTLAVDTNSVLAWKNGRLQFQGETLAEIAATLESWYGIKIGFANPGMRSCRYYMSFDNTISLDTLMSTMSGITETQYAFDKSKNTMILSGRSCY